MDVTSSLRSLLPYGRRSIGISQLVSKLEGYLPPDEVERVQDAYDFAFEAHQGQRRRSGEPYITHPVAVADLLADLRLDPQTLIAAILHDVIEDTPTLKEGAARRCRWARSSTCTVFESSPTPSTPATARWVSDPARYDAERVQASQKPNVRHHPESAPAANGRYRFRGW